MKKCIAVLMLMLPTSACMSAYKKSVGEDTNQVFTKVFFADFNTAWQAILESLKTQPLDISNRESGYLRTQWIDNTDQKNFIEAYGTDQLYLKAQSRYEVTAAKGFYNGQPSVKIIVQKEQLVSQDVLEGWRPVPSDAIEERTLLYRIGRLIWLQQKLAKMEAIKADKAVEEFQRGGSSSSENSSNAAEELPEDSSDDEFEFE